MWYPVVLGLLVIIGSNLQDTEALQPLDPFTLSAFTSQFRECLFHIVYAEKEKTETMADTLKEDMATCKTTLTTQQATCKECAKNKCSPSFGEIIENYLNKALDPIEEVGIDIISWGGWAEMSDFYEGIGEAFIDWGGWGDMKDFFTDIASGIGNWGGWTDIADFGEDFYNELKKIEDIFDFDNPFGWKKRDIDTLSSLYRMLAYLHKRKLEQQRRDIDPEVRECMEQCSSCAPFLGEFRAMVGSVCGQDLLDLNDTVAFRAKVIMLIYQYIVDNTTAIVESISYNPFSLDPVKGYFTEVTISARFESGYMSYASSVGYRFIAIPTMAALMSLEYCQEWNLCEKEIV